MAAYAQKDALAKYLPNTAAAVPSVNMRKAFLDPILPDKYPKKRFEITIPIFTADTRTYWAVAISNGSMLEKL